MPLRKRESDTSTIPTTTESEGGDSKTSEPTGKGNAEAAPLKYDPEKARLRSRHYMAFVATQPCLVCENLGVEQTSRTTVHHVVKSGYSKKGPDFWTVPIEEKRHVHGRQSIDRLGKRKFLEHYGLPSWVEVTLPYLAKYAVSGLWEEAIWGTGDWGVVDPKPTDRHGAFYFLEELERILKEEKPLRYDTWNRPPSA